MKMNKEKIEKNNQNFDIYKVIKELEDFFGGNINAAVRVVNDAAISAAYKNGYEARKKEAREKDRDYKDGLEDGRFEVLYALKKIVNDKRLLLLFGAHNLNYVIEKYSAEEIIEKSEKFEEDANKWKEAEDKIEEGYNILQDLKARGVIETGIKKDFNNFDQNALKDIKGCHNCKSQTQKWKYFEYIDSLYPCKGCIDHSKWEEDYKDEEDDDNLPCMTCKHRNNNCQLYSPECHYDRHFIDEEIEKCKECMYYPENGISTNSICIKYFNSIHEVEIGDEVINTTEGNKFGKGIVTEAQDKCVTAHVVWSSGASGRYLVSNLRRTGKRYGSLARMIKLMG